MKTTDFRGKTGVIKTLHQIIHHFSTTGGVKIGNGKQYLNLSCHTELACPERSRGVEAFNWLNLAKTNNVFNGWAVFGSGLL